MDQQGTSCILPSNAPSFHDHDLPGPTVPYRVLQEGCRNSQFDAEHNFQYGKLEYSSPSENDFPDCARQRRISKELTEEDVRRLATKLWRHMLRCKPYAKYRSRQPKEGASNQDIKWPEHMEMAFCRALVKYYPRGKRVRYPPLGQQRTIMHADEDKPRGRNEMISDEIQKLTGEYRSRKQVSSHIQVLKPMVKNDRFIMKYLAYNEAGNSNPHHRHTKMRDSMHRRNSISIHQSRSHLYSGAFPDPRYTTSAKLLPCNGSDADPSATSADNKSTTFQPVAHEPVHFAMFVQDKTAPEGRQHIHRITHLRHDPSGNLSAREQDLVISDERLLKEFLPALASLYDSGALTHEGCQVIFARASMELWAGTIPKGAELGIQFWFASEQRICDLERFEGFECVTSFWREREDGLGVREVHRSADEKRAVEYEEGYKRLGNVQFCSGFWAAKVVELGGKLREVGGLRRKADEADSRKEKENLLMKAKQVEAEIRDALEGLSAVQEISARVKGAGEGTRRRLLVVHWEFEQTIQGQKAEMTWRNVVFLNRYQGLDTVKKEETGAASSSLVSWQNDSFDSAMAIHGLNHVPNNDLIPGFGHLTDHQDPGFNLGALQALPSLARLHNSAGIQSPTSANQAQPSLYSANAIDFTGGHIQLCMDSSGPSCLVIDNNATDFNANNFALHNQDDLSQARQQSVIYTPHPQYPSSQWHHAYASEPYFDLNGFGTDPTAIVTKGATQQPFGSADESAVGAGHGYGSFSTESDVTAGQSFCHTDASVDGNQGTVMPDGSQTTLLPSVEFNDHNLVA